MIGSRRRSSAPTAMTPREIVPVLLLAAVAGGSSPLPEYATHRTDASPAALIEGEPAAWAPAAVAEYGPRPWTTRFRALWSDDGLWLRWDAEDERPWHTLTERDDPIWNEEVVEIFLDPDGDGRDYAELEISPGGVATDLLVRQGMPDLRTEIEWDVENLAWRVVHEEGAWRAIARLPWRGLAEVPGAGGGSPPSSATAWRFNLFRIKRPHGPTEPEREAVYAAWSPVPGPSFHVPEVFGWMRFLD